MFTYMAKIVSVYDGDTVRADIDLGFGVILAKQQIRLLGINAPEMRGSEKAKGRISRDTVRAKILNKRIILKTYKDKTGKYGRWLAEIYFCKSGSISAAASVNDDVTIKSLTSLNEYLVEEGLAERHKY